MWTDACCSAQVGDENFFVIRFLKTKRKGTTKKTNRLSRGYIYLRSKCDVDCAIFVTRYLQGCVCARRIFVVTF